MEAVGGIVLAAVFLATLWVSRSYLLAFFLFGMSGAVLLNGGLFAGLKGFFSQHLFAQLTDPVKAAMVVFIAFYCGYVGFMEYGGPIKGYTRWCLGRAEKGGGGKAQLWAWFASVSVFFSDLGSPGITGSLFREKYNRERVPRETLALMLNLTAVPVCSMVPIVGWGLFAIAILHGVGAVAPLGETPIAVFLQAVPWFCLPLLAIVTPLLALSPRFRLGRLEEARRECKEDHEGYLARRKPHEAEIDLAKEEVSGWALLGSIAVILLALGGCLALEGQGLFRVDTGSFMSYLAIGFTLAAAAVMLLLHGTGQRPFMQSFGLYTSMFKRVLSVTGIMAMSWVFFEVADATGLYGAIAGFLSGYLPGVLAMPLLFWAGCLLSRGTGSAWGTYAVMLPLAVLLAQGMGLPLAGAVGAAVSGGVYGDISANNSHAMHYSAQSAGVDHRELQRIQQPYLAAMALVCTVVFAVDYYTQSLAVHLLLGAVLYPVALLAAKQLEKMRRSAK